MKDKRFLKSNKSPGLSFKRSNGPVDEAIDRLMRLAGGIRRPEIVRDMILAALKAGQEDDGKVDLKIMDTSLKEMRFTARVFAPYRDIRKVTVFGSGRTKPHESAYQMAHHFGRKLAEAGYMVITGGGSGIMQAVNEGAGPDYSFGANIRLPFEQMPNPVIADNPRSITYKYFFNRKVAFLKEADAVALFPGGFGTHDEAMETLTLLQTGKHNPLPLVLVDEPQGTYWMRWFEFIEKELLAEGYVSYTDFGLFEIVHSVDDAIRCIDRFYKRYHSMRYIGERLVIRLMSPLSQEKIQKLKSDFADILRPPGDIFLSEPLDVETDEPEINRLSRLVLDFDRKSFGRLRTFINAINDA